MCLYMFIRFNVVALYVIVLDLYGCIIPHKNRQIAFYTELLDYFYGGAFKLCL